MIKTLNFPRDLSIKQDQQILKIKGPIGITSFNLSLIDPTGDLSFKLNNNSLKILLLNIKNKALLITCYKLLSTLFHSVCFGFFINITLIGVGYRITQKDDFLQIKCGFSHKLQIKIPTGIKVFIVNSTQIILFGVNAAFVQHYASTLKQLLKPDPYKGKGLRFHEEELRLKPKL